MAPEHTAILILDDVDVVRSRILDMLRDLKVDFLEANSAPSAVQAIRQYQPKVAILDIQVPGDALLKNGMDVLRWAHINYPKTAVIMITNFDLPQYRKVCTALGAAHFFDKSHEIDQLYEAVKELIEKP